jgi:hypothetical protein
MIGIVNGDIQTEVLQRPKSHHEASLRSTPVPMRCFIKSPVAKLDSSIYIGTIRISRRPNLDKRSRTSGLGIDKGRDGCAGRCGDSAV